jgi:WD40 repeat protein
LREIEASGDGSVNAITITKDGNYLITGGEDRCIRIWDYDKGKCLYKGNTNSGSVTHIALSHDNKTIVTVSDEGAIYLWKFPTL